MALPKKFALWLARTGSQEVIQKIVLGSGSTKKCDHDCDQSSTHENSILGICIEYKYISEFMLWLHRGKFVNIK